MVKTKVVEFYNFTKNFKENLKKKYIPNILPVSKESKVNRTNETYYKNLVKYYSNELAIKPIKKVTSAINQILLNETKKDIHSKKDIR